jgi:predicted transposase YdaD
MKEVETMLELTHGLRETRVYQDAREEGLKESIVEILSA